MNTRTSFALVLLGLASLGFAQNIAFDPGVALTVWSNGSNDGYSDGRGIWFQADENVTATGAGWFNGFNGEENFTMTLWTASSDGSNLRDVNLGSFVVTPSSGDGYRDGSFAGAINLTAGSYYALEVTSDSSFPSNYFYDWDGPGVDVGPVTILDGYQAQSLSNFVAPALRLNVVPEPVSMVALGAGLAALVARRRRK